MLFARSRLFVQMPQTASTDAHVVALPAGPWVVPPAGGGRRAGVPEHAVFGEEEGMAGGAGAAPSPWLWVLDPIDGTKSFITGGAAHAARGRGTTAAHARPAAGEI